MYSMYIYVYVHTCERVYIHIYNCMYTKNSIGVSSIPSWV